MMKLSILSLWIIILCHPYLQASDLEAQIGQLLIATFYGNDLDQETEALIHETKIGNWIFFAKCSDLTQKERVIQLTLSLSDTVKTATSFSPFLLIDQEGGRVSHLTGEFTTFPPPVEWQDPEQAYAIGLQMGEELRAAGFSGTLAPVVDVATPVTLERFRQRMFGGDPERVISMARAFIKGLHENGSLAVLKHFPGHGVTTADSHLSLPRIDLSMAQLQERELKPFYELMHEADGMMVAHLLVPAGDSQRPASLSPFWQTELLRRQLNYQGLMITDSLTMHGVLKGELKTFEQVADAIADSAKQAFLAGADLLLIGPLDQFSFPHGKQVNERLLRHLVKSIKLAVECGEISESRVQDSYERIIKLKLNLETLDFDVKK